MLGIRFMLECISLHPYVLQVRYFMYRLFYVKYLYGENFQQTLRTQSLIHVDLSSSQK